MARITKSTSDGAGENQSIESRVVRARDMLNAKSTDGAAPNASPPLSGDPVQTAATIRSSAAPIAMGGGAKRLRRSRWAVVWRWTSAVGASGLLHVMLLAGLACILLPARRPKERVYLDAGLVGEFDEAEPLTVEVDDPLSETLLMREGFQSRTESLVNLEDIFDEGPGSENARQLDSIMGDARLALTLQGSLDGRRGATKSRLLRKYGGTPESEHAVEDGLAWLVKLQQRDGRWTLDSAGPATINSDTSATALALLSLLAAGFTQDAGKYRGSVGRGLDWLAAQQKANGDLFAGGTPNARMYSHAQATIALCEAYAMTGDPKLQAPVQKAVRFIEQSQHPGTGGWRYQPRQAGDTSVVGWQVMALKTAQIAGIRVNSRCLDSVKTWLRSVAHGDDRCQFSYVPGQAPTRTMTAEALLCWQYLGMPRDDPVLQKGVDYLLEELPGEGRKSLYYWYYATQVMHHQGGEAWIRWNAAARNHLVETQIREDEHFGSWAGGRWSKEGGRLYTTALSLLILEVYYRHLPLYGELR